MPQCPNCEADAEPGATTCLECGSSMEAVPTDDDWSPPISSNRTNEPDSSSPAIQTRDSSQSTNQLEDEVVALLQNGRKIEAIKLLRETMDCDLAAGKHAVETIAAQHGLTGSKKAGCAGMILLCLTVATLVVSVLLEFTA